MEKILGSVGKKGLNRHKDVSVVQTLLNGCLHLIGPLKMLSVDGKIGPASIGAIEQFQQVVLKIQNPDGRVDPNGKTLRTLNQKSVSQTKPQPFANFTDIDSLFSTSKTTTTYKFPLVNRPSESYTSGMRRFGSRRKKGRLHAGCDLYATIGTDVLALDDGVVEVAKYPFYLGTYAIEIKHPDFLARYGELGTVSTALTQGAKVKKGQKIGTVGELRGLNMSMLHLELYSGKLKGKLTDRNNSPYQRRSDLIDPTPVLDKAK